MLRAHLQETRDTPIVINGGEGGRTPPSALGFTRPATLLLLLLTISASRVLNICKVEQNLVQDLKTIRVGVLQRKLDWYVTKMCKFTL